MAAGGKGFVYEPAEDSFLLLKAAGRARGDVLELFAGSGLVGFGAAKKAGSVVFADVNEAAIGAINRRIKTEGLKNCSGVVSDLFSGLDGRRFDTIYMNPPYLPDAGNAEEPSERALSGGKHGYELTVKALKQAKDHLNKGGEIFTIISTVYDVRKVYKALESINFKSEVLDTKKFFFEELILVKIYEKRRNSHS